MIAAHFFVGRSSHQLPREQAGSNPATRPALEPVSYTPRYSFIVDDRKARDAGQEHVHGLRFDSEFADASITFKTRDRRVVLAHRTDMAIGADLLREVA